jgi:hypothetical protein
MTEDQNFDDTTLAVARRRYTRQMIVGAALAFVVTVISALLALPIDLTSMKTLVPVAAGTITVAFLLVLALRRAGVRWAQPSPLLGLERLQRRAAFRALRPGGAVNPAHRAATVLVARYYLQCRRWYPWIMLATSLLLGRAYLTEIGPEHWFFGFAALLSLVTAGSSLVTLRKAAAIVRDSEDEPH